MKRAWKDDRIQAEMAGMTRETQSGMEVGRLIEPGWFTTLKDVSIVETDDAGPVLFGRHPPDIDGTQDYSSDYEVEYQPGTLEPFLRLAEGSLDDILAFANRYGILGLCKHSMPWTHNIQGWDPFGSDVPICGTPLSGAERVDAWIGHSAQFRNIIRISAALHRGHLPPRDVVLSRRSEADSTRATWDDVKFLVNRNLHRANIRPSISYDPPSLVFSSHTLYGHLAMELALMTMKVDGLYICSGCANPYVPEHKPRTGTRSYCATCRKTKVPEKLAMRRYRARKRDMNET